MTELGRGGQLATLWVRALVETQRCQSLVHCRHWLRSLAWLVVFLFVLADFKNASVDCMQFLLFCLYNDCLTVPVLLFWG